MTAGYLAALVERHLSPEPTVAPRARSAFEPDAAAADPFDAPPSAESPGDPSGVDDVDPVAKPESAPRRTFRRRIRALAPEPMDEIVAPDPAPRRPRGPATASAAPAVDPPAARPSSTEVPPPAGEAAAPPRTSPPARTPRPKGGASVERAPEPVAVSPAPLRIARQVAQVQPAADAGPLPRVDLPPPRTARRERGMDTGRSAAIHPAPEPPSAAARSIGGGRRGMDVRPAEDAAPPRRGADPRPARSPSTGTRSGEDRAPAAPLPPSASTPSPSIVMVQPVVRSAPPPAAVAEAAEAPAPAPVIEVSIGRIEVRATQAPASAAPVRHASSALSLDDYLRRRGGGR